MESSRRLVTRLKENRIVDAILLTIILGVIASTAYVAHDTRLDLIDQRETARLATMAQEQALKAAQELNESKWRQFFRDNPEAVVPKRFFKRETIEELEKTNEMMAPTLPNGRPPADEASFKPDPKPPLEPMPGPATSILEAPIKNQP